MLLRHVSTPVPYHSLIAEACAHDRSEVLSTLFCQMRIPAAKYSDTQVRRRTSCASSQARPSVGRHFMNTQTHALGLMDGFALGCSYS